MYADLTDVQGLLGLDFSATSKPSADQVTKFLALIESEVRGALLGGGYETAPGEDEAREILVLYTATGAAALVLDARADTEHAAQLHKRYRAWLDQVAQGSASGLEAQGEVGLLPSSAYTKNPSTHPQPVFRRNEVQW